MTKVRESQIFGVKTVETVVVGAGLAGVEAAYRLACKKREVLTITSSWDTAVQPAFLPALSQQEIDKVLASNNSLLRKVLKKVLFELPTKPKSYYLDKVKLQMLSKNLLEQSPYCYLWQDTVDLINKKSSGYELITHWGLKVKAKKVIVACGTFLDGQVFIGNTAFPGGKLGELGSAKFKTELEKVGVQFEQRELSIPALIKVEAKMAAFKEGFVPVAKEGNLFSALNYSQYLCELSLEKQKKLIKAEVGATASLVAPAYKVKYWIRAAKQEREQTSLIFIGKAAGATSFVESIMAAGDVSRET